MLKNIRVHYNLLEVESSGRLSRAYFIVDSDVFILEESFDNLWIIPVSGKLKKCLTTPKRITLYLKDNSDFSYAYNIIPFQPVIPVSSEEDIIELDDLKTVRTIHHQTMELDRSQQKKIIKDFIRPPKYPDFEEKKILKELIFNFIEKVKSIAKKTPKPDMNYFRENDSINELDEIPDIENLELPHMESQIPLVFLQKVGGHIRILVRAVVHRGLCSIILNEDKVQSPVFKGESYFWQKQLPAIELAAVNQFKLEIETADFSGKYFVENKLTQFVQSNLRRLKLIVIRADDDDWEEPLETSIEDVDISSIDGVDSERFRLISAEEIDSKNTLIKDLEEKIKNREIAIAEFENLLASVQNNNSPQEDQSISNDKLTFLGTSVKEIKNETNDSDSLPERQKAVITITQARVCLSANGNSVVIDYESNPEYIGTAVLNITDKLIEKARFTGSRLIFDRKQNTKKIWGRLMSKMPMNLRFPGAADIPVYEIQLKNVSEEFVQKESGDYKLDISPVDANDEDDVW